MVVLLVVVLFFFCFSVVVNVMYSDWEENGVLWTDIRISQVCNDEG